MSNSGGGGDGEELPARVLEQGVADEIETRFTKLETELSQVSVRVRNLEERHNLMMQECRTGFTALGEQLKAHLSDEQITRVESLKKQVASRDSIIKAIAGVLVAVITALGAWAVYLAKS